MGFWGRLKGISILWHLTGIVLLIASAFAFTPQRDTYDGSPRLTQAVLLFIAGGAVLRFAPVRAKINNQDGGAVYSTPTAHHPNIHDERHTPHIYGHNTRLLFLPGAVLLLAFGMVSALNLPVSHHIQFVSLIAGIVFVMLSLSRADRASHDLLMIPRWEWRVIAVITLFALFLRVWRLGSLHLLVDETNFLDGVMHFWDNPHTTMLSPMAGVAPFTRLHAYWETWTVALFGRNLAGFRMASAVIGALNITAVWWLARHLFAIHTQPTIPPRLLRALPLVAALILATFPPHLHFSRLALNNISDPLFGTLALAFLARARLTNHLRDTVLAGIMLGLTHYFHNAGQLFWMGLIALWILWDALRRQPFSWRSIGFLVLAAVIVMLPVYLAWSVLDLPLVARFNEGRLSNTYWHDLLISHDPETINQHLIRTMRAFLIYVHIPEETIFYAGGTALVLPLLLPALFYGFWLCLWRGPVLLAVWPVLVAFGSSLLRDSATATRFLPAFPALVILIAVGLCGLAGLFFSLVERDWYTRPLFKFSLAAKSQADNWRWSGLQIALIGLIGLAITAYQINYYVYDHLPLFNIQHRERRVREDVEDAILRLVQDERFQPGTTHVHMMAHGPVDYFSVNAFMSFLADGYPIAVEPQQVLKIDYFTTFRADFDHAVFILPDDQQATNWLLANHPHVEPPEYSPYPDYAGEQFLLYRVAPLMERPNIPVPDRAARHERDTGIMGAGMLLIFIFLWRRKS